jgi:hypothetical protein
MITSRILKRLTISGHKVNIELHGSFSSLVISKRSAIKKILNILLLRQKEPLRCGADLNPMEVPHRTKIRHKKLITKLRLNKSNVPRVITSDDHVGGKTSSSDQRGKTLKPSMRSLLKAVKRETKVTNYTLRDRIPHWWAHVNISRSSPLRKAFFTSS